MFKKTSIYLACLLTSYSFNLHAQEEYTKSFEYSNFRADYYQEAELVPILEYISNFQYSDGSNGSSSPLTSISGGNSTIDYTNFGGSSNGVQSDPNFIEGDFLDPNAGIPWGPGHPDWTDTPKNYDPNNPDHQIPTDGNITDQFIDESMYKDLSFNVLACDQVKNNLQFKGLEDFLPLFSEHWRTLGSGEDQDHFQLYPEYHPTDLTYNGKNYGPGAVLLMSGKRVSPRDGSVITSTNNNPVVIQKCNIRWLIPLNIAQKHGVAQDYFHSSVKISAGGQVSGNVGFGGSTPVNTGQSNVNYVTNSTLQPNLEDPAMLDLTLDISNFAKTSSDNPNQLKLNFVLPDGQIMSYNVPVTDGKHTATFQLPTPEEDYQYQINISVVDTNGITHQSTKYVNYVVPTPLDQSGGH